MNFNTKNDGKGSLTYETKASMSFIPMRRMSLGCLIMKRKSIAMGIHVCPNWQINLNNKNDGQRNFSYKTNASMSFILIRRMSIWCPMKRRKGIIMWIHVYRNWKTSFNSKHGRMRSISYETKAAIHLSQCGEWICGAQSLEEKR